MRTGGVVVSSEGVCLEAHALGRRERVPDCVGSPETVRVVSLWGTKVQFRLLTRIVEARSPLGATRRRVGKRRGEEPVRPLLREPPRVGEYDLDLRVSHLKAREGVCDPGTRDAPPSLTRKRLSAVVKVVSRDSMGNLSVCQRKILLKG